MITFVSKMISPCCKFLSYVLTHHQKSTTRSTSLFNKIYQYNKYYFKKFELFYKKYYLILKYDFLQKLFKRKKSYYKKVGYNPRCNLKEISS